jgi:hypothetical protein
MATVPPPVPANVRPAPEHAASAASTSRRMPTPYVSSTVLGAVNGLQELPPFFHQPAQSLRDSERGIAHDVKDSVDRSPGYASLGKIYGWGPRTGDWDTQGRWQVKWLSPFSGWPEVRASLPTLPPAFIVDMTRGASSYYGGYGGYYGGGSQNYQFVPGDDANHALLVARRVQRNDNMLFELEADRAPLEVHRADGEPFGEIEGAVRVAGRWFLATPPTSQLQTYNAQPSTTTVIWQVEGAIARELVRVPRAMSEVGTYMSGGYMSSRGTRMARRSDGRAVGLVADGHPNAERPGTNTRWVLPIDLETGALGEPELLGYVDLAGRTLDACGDELVGWVLDSSLPSSSAIRLKLPTGSGVLTGTNARLRLSTDRACIERLSGGYDGSSERASQVARPGAASRATLPPRAGDILVAATNSQTRFPLRCTIAK